MISFPVPLPLTDHHLRPARPPPLLVGWKEGSWHRGTAVRVYRNEKSREALGRSHTKPVGNQWSAASLAHIPGHSKALYLVYTEPLRNTTAESSLLSNSIIGSLVWFISKVNNEKEMHAHGKKTQTRMSVSFLLFTPSPSSPLPKGNHCYSFLVEPSDGKA